MRDKPKYCEGCKYYENDCGGNSGLCLVRYNAIQDIYKEIDSHILKKINETMEKQKMKQLLEQINKLSTLTQQYPNVLKVDINIIQDLSEHLNNGKSLVVKKGVRETLYWTSYRRDEITPCIYVEGEHINLPVVDLTTIDKQIEDIINKIDGNPMFRNKIFTVGTSYYFNKNKGEWYGIAYLIEI
jgi:hypothetical protein